MVRYYSLPGGLVTFCIFGEPLMPLRFLPSPVTLKDSYFIRFGFLKGMLSLVCTFNAVIIILKYLYGFYHFYILNPIFILLLQVCTFHEELILMVIIISWNLMVIYLSSLLQEFIFQEFICTFPLVFSMIHFHKPTFSLTSLFIITSSFSFLFHYRYSP